MASSQRSRLVHRYESGPEVNLCQVVPVSCMRKVPGCDSVVIHFARSQASGRSKLQEKPKLVGCIGSADIGTALLCGNRGDVAANHRTAFSTVDGNTLRIYFAWFIAFALKTASQRTGVAMNPYCSD